MFFFPVKILHMALKEINILVIYNFLYIYITKLTIFWPYIFFVLNKLIARISSKYKHFFFKQWIHVFIIYKAVLISA